MTGTIEVTVKVYLTADVDGNSTESREIAQAIVDGVRHPMIDHVELIDLDADDEVCIDCGGANIMEGTCVDCEAKDQPPVIQAIDRTTKDGSCTLIGFFSDNAERLLFSYYIDELTFADSDLIGLTEEQAHQLRQQRDVAYLRS